jgi:hypothetical protein
VAGFRGAITQRIRGVTDAVAQIVADPGQAQRAIVGVMQVAAVGQDQSFQLAAGQVAKLGDFGAGGTEA